MTRGVQVYMTWAPFLVPRYCGKGRFMTKDNDKKTKEPNEEVIIVTDDAGMQL